MGDRHVHESLDLCLACKGCKSDCPINVDIATYKAEFLAHHYQGRLRPVAAYSMGLVHWWARLAARAPGFANAIAQSPFTAPLFKRLGGVAPERRIPMFATRTFKQIWRRRAPRNLHGQPVVLWPDTFNNHFFPETALAAAEVLEALGFRVVVPEGDVCCGRPLYDFGMLTTAKRLLQKDLRVLQSEIAASTPVVGLEPSCISVFRDEMTNLLPRNRDAQRLRSQTFLFAEFMTKHADPDRLAKLHAKPSSMATVTTRRCSASTTRSGCCRRSASTSRCSRPVAAGWPARSGSSGAKSTGCRSRSASSTCCPRCAPPIPRRSWSATDSAAGSKSAPGRRAARCTSPRWRGWPSPGRRSCRPLGRAARSARPLGVAALALAGLGLGALLGPARRAAAGVGRRLAAAGLGRGAAGALALAALAASVPKEPKGE